jgi:hypothetical protein
MGIIKKIEVVSSHKYMCGESNTSSTRDSKTTYSFYPRPIQVK